MTTELGRGYGSEVKPEHLLSFSAEQEAWCRATLAEIQALEQINLGTLEEKAPQAFAQLLNDAEGQPPRQFLEQHEGGLTSYLGELTLWCRQQLKEAEARPRLLQIAAQVRDRGMVLPPEALELLSRYQTTLDNQLYKALRALREVQEWRLKTIEPAAAPSDGMAPLVEAA